ELGCTVGIMITASHNPPEYNGYKVYWNDGAQVVEPHDKGIISQVQQVSGAVAAMPKEEALSKGLLEYLGTDFDGKFFDMVLDNVVSPDLLREHGKDLKIVFTPLHGTGTYPVESVLQRLQVPVTTVPEQREPDGEFPTVTFPNPEEAAAMDMALDLAKKTDADIVMGTDPDADRLGIAVPDDGAWVLLNGNQLGTLLVDYVFHARKEQGTLPAKPVFANTVVTTELQNRIAESYGARTYRTLTGFKHIAGVIREMEQTQDGGTFLMGDEESYGFMFGTKVRDKDAISAVVLTAEMALYHRVQGKTVMQRLREIYREYGWYREILVSKYFKGQSGLGIMQGLMEKLRNNPPADIGGIKLVKIIDYRSSETIDPAAGTREQNIDLPSSNVLQFFGGDGTVISARPSGTEPKIKFYVSAHTEPGVAASSAEQQLNAVMEKIQDTIHGWIDAAEKAAAEESNG
ncbi:MAG: phospho-sugar mutase, partial [Spirochaeta sp.]